MYNEEIVKQNLQRKLRADTRQSMARKATQAPVLFDIGKHNLDGLSPQAIHRLRFGRLHPSPVGLDQLFVFTALHTAAAFLTRRTLLA
jgi:hypothetical protein